MLLLLFWLPVRLERSGSKGFCATIEFGVWGGGAFDVLSVVPGIATMPLLCCVLRGCAGRLAELPVRSCALVASAPAQIAAGAC